MHTDATYFLYFLYQRLPFPLISPPFPHRCYIFPSFPVPSLPHSQPFCPFAPRCYIFPLFLVPPPPFSPHIPPISAPLLHISIISCTIASTFPTFLSFCTPMLHISAISCTIATTFPTFPSLLRTDATYFRNFLHHRYHISDLSFPSAHRCYTFPLFLVPSPLFSPHITPISAPMLHISTISRTIAVYCASGRTTASTVHLSEPSANIIVTLSPAFLPRAPFSTTPSASVARTYPL